MKLNILKPKQIAAIEVIFSVKFLFECDYSKIASYGDENTPYFCVNEMPSVIVQL